MKSNKKKDKKSTKKFKDLEKKISKLKKIEARFRQLDKELTLERRLFESFLYNIPVSVYFKDKEGRYLRVGKYFLEQKGAPTLNSTDEVLGKSDFDLFPEELAKLSRTDELQIMKTGKPIIEREESETVDGDKVYLLTTKAPLTDDKGNTIGIIGITREVTEKKELEEKLKEKLTKLGEEVILKSNLLTSLLNNIPDLIYFKDKKSRFIRVNKAKAQKAGKEEDFFIGKTDLDFFPKNEAEEMLKDEKQIIKKGKPIIKKEQKVTRPDGKEEWVSVTKVPRYDKKGNIIGTLGISRDVTHRKKTEEQLRESEERNRAILSALPDLLFQVKKDGTFISYNTGNENVLYSSPEEFINKNIKDILPGHLAAKSMESIKKAIKTDSVITFEYQLPIKDKMQDWEARFTKIDKSTAIILIRNITEIKKAQQEIYRLKDLLEQSPSSLLRLDPEMRIDYANRTMKQVFGYSINELKGKTLEFLIAEADSNEIHREIKNTVSKGKTYSNEHLNIKKDGSVFFCLMKIIPLYDSNGSIYSYMASMTDISEERKARDELVFRRNLLDSFLELTPDLVFFKDRDCRFVEVSKSQAEKFDVERDEIIGKSDFSFLDEDKAEINFEEEQNIMNSEKLLLDQEAKTAINDKNLWFSTTKVPRYNKEGEVIGIIGISRDITRLKKIEEDLRKEEELLSNALESMENGILVLDQDFHCTYWNNSMEKITGTPRKKILNSKKIPWEIFPNLKEAKVDRMMKQAMNGEVVKRDRIHYELENGKKMFTSEMYLPLRNPEGQIYGIVGVVKEITKEIEAEETIRESEEKYRTLVENSREGICIFRNDRFLFVNDYLCKILNYSKEDLYEIEIWQIISEDDRTLVKELEHRREKGEEMPNVYEANIITSDGDIRFCEFSVRKITYQGLESFMGIIRDITEYKDMEKEREKADRLESLGLLAGGIAHDFNNFLTGILGNISLAKLHLDPQEEAYDILQESERAAQSARSLTQQLLTFSKGGAPVKINLALEDLVRNSANFVLSGSNVRSNLELPDDFWNVRADRGQLTQVFNNLILNANQSMPEGGVITIRGKNITITKDTQLPLKPGKYVLIEVRDKGIGIPSEVISRIFDPFFTTKQKGSGLGLSTVFSIIKRHEGHVTVESVPEEGTSFFIYLPSIEKRKSIERKTKKEISQGKGGKVLVMDDKSFVRNAAVKALKLFGYEAKGACDGIEALNLYKDAMDAGKPFDVVILDLTIPGGMGGEDTLKKLREIDPKTKAIVSSGYSDDPVMAGYKKHGFNAIVNKPYQYEELCKVVQKVIEEK